MLRPIKPILCLVSTRIQSNLGHYYSTWLRFMISRLYTGYSGEVHTPKNTHQLQNRNRNKHRYTDTDTNKIE